MRVQRAWMRALKELEWRRNFTEWEKSVAEDRYDKGF